MTERDSKIEAVFDSWGLTYKFDPAYPVDQIQDVASQQVRDQANRANAQFVEEYYNQHQAGAVFPPIVLRANGTIIDGNTRLAMWRRAKLTAVPVYLVELPSTDLARTLGAQLNQMGAVRLTPDESARQALAMLEEGVYDETQIARIVGRSRTQVGRWKHERDFKTRAERYGLAEQINNVPPKQRQLLPKVAQAKPFAELTRLAATRKLPTPELAAVVEKVIVAESEEEQLATIGAFAAEMHPIGPDKQVVAINPKARRMRMVLPQVLNLSPPDDFYEPAKAATDRAMWLQVKIAAENALAMYDRYSEAA